MFPCRTARRWRAREKQSMRFSAPRTVRRVVVECKRRRIITLLPDFPKDEGREVQQAKSPSICFVPERTACTKQVFGTWPCGGPLECLVETPHVIADNPPPTLKKRSRPVATAPCSFERWCSGTDLKSTLERSRKRRKRSHRTGPHATAKLAVFQLARHETNTQRGKACGRNWRRREETPLSDL